MGLAFKPNTDDMREAPSRVIMEALWKGHATVRAYDPKAMEGCRRIYGERSDLVLCESQNEALEGADALILATEWKSFQTPDFESMRTMLKESVIFDGRNIYDLEAARRHGICVHGVGRGTSLVDDFEPAPTAS
jgi:UDPglucose 6-dehydrogenase